MSIDSDNNEILVESLKEESKGTKPVVERKMNDGFTVFINNQNNNNNVVQNNNVLPQSRVLEINNIAEDSRPYSLENLRNLNTPELSKFKRRAAEGDIESVIEKMNINMESDPRKEAIYQEALMYGTQSALHARSYQLNKFLEDNAKYYSKVFNFQPLLLEGGRVIPPIVIEAERLFAHEDKYTLRTVNKSYTILEQAKVINTPLIWQKFFDYYITKPNMPDARLLPLNEIEDSYWEKGILEGWKIGTNQANSIFLESLKKLSRDYVGMVRFHLMLKQNLITYPITTTTNLGVTSSENTLNIGESIFEITQLPDFNMDLDSWRALPQMKDFNID